MAGAWACTHSPKKENRETNPSLEQFNKLDLKEKAKISGFVFKRRRQVSISTGFISEKLFL